MSKNNKQQFTDEEMITALKNFVKLNGRHPHMKDLKGKKPSSDVIAKRFGTWNNALKMAGISKDKEKSTDYTKEYMIECLFEYYKKTNKVPTARGMRSLGYPSIHAYINHFGSIKNALIETGLFELRNDKHQFCETYTDEEMLENLKSYMSNKDRIPVHSIIKQELKNPSISAYERRFYSIFNALKLVGYDYEKQKDQDLVELEIDMLNKYKKLKEQLGRTPSSRDIEYFSRKDNSIINSMSSYEFHFGSLYQLQVLCEFTPTVIGRNKSRQDLIDDLIMMSDELDKTPSQLDVKYFENVASSTSYLNEFGSWTDAIKESGLIPQGKIYYSIKGTKCLSYYELLFANMLETYGINFKKEVFYRDYMPLDRKFRFDYVLNFNNEEYFVEIFGITDNKDYEEKTKYKVQLCKENKLKLIAIYPKDFKSYKLDELHKMLEEKIDLI